jgi:Epoxide hydrolase N terminus
MRITLPIIVATLGFTSPSWAQNPSASPAEDKAIRRFQINIQKEAVADMRERIAATRWPEKEAVADATQGVQLATMQKLARYWGTEYDWSK